MSYAQRLEQGKIETQVKEGHMKSVSILFLFGMVPQLLLSNVLPKANVDQSIEANSISVTAITVSEFGVVTFVPRRSVLSVYPFKEDGKNREERFGTMLDAQKFTIKDKQKNFVANFGFLSKSDEAVLFDGEALNTAIYSMKDKKIWRFGDLIYDKIRPARDRGGEATRSEIAELRSRVSREILKTKGVKFFNARRIPPKWIGSPQSKSTNLLALTTLKSAPLVQIQCHHENKARCIVVRKCNIRSGARLQGIALRQSQRLLITSRNNRIEIYKYRSCGSISFIKSIAPPKNFPQITDIDTDGKGRLWVSVEGKEKKTHGSVFFWNRNEW